MKIYLDTSVYNRPFDDQTQPRIWLETLAFVVILQMIEAREVALVSSAVLEYENSRNPFALRQQWVNRCLGLGSYYQKVDKNIRQRAEELERAGVQAIDALHAACAEAAGSAYFLTCDDRLLRRYRGPLQMRNPTDFVLYVVGGQP